MTGNVSNFLLINLSFKSIKSLFNSVLRVDAHTYSTKCDFSRVYMPKTCDVDTGLNIKLLVDGG